MRQHRSDDLREPRWRLCLPTAILGAANQVADHVLEAHLHAVVRVIDALDAVLHQFAYFFGRNRATAATKYLDMRCAKVSQAIDHVTKELIVPALVGADGDAVGVFLDRGPNDVVNAAVVAEVDDFCTLSLDQASHDIDGGVVAIEQGGSGNETQWRPGCRPEALAFRTERCS